jgi:hypothetical protein
MRNTEKLAKKASRTLALPPVEDIEISYALPRESGIGRT